MKPNNLMPAVFLDRDGTIIEDRGHLVDPSEVVFFPETSAALNMLAREFRLFVITHQGGIAEGIITPAQANAVNTFIREELSREGIWIERFYCCPHRREDICPCLKPSPFHLFEAASDYGIDLAASFVVGDHPHDPQTGLNAGGGGVYVLTGHGRRHREEVPPGVPIAADISEAAEIILSILQDRKKGARL